MSSWKRSVDSRLVLSSIHVTRTEIRYISLVVMHISMFLPYKRLINQPTNYTASGNPKISVLHHTAQHFQFLTFEQPMLAYSDAGENHQ